MGTKLIGEEEYRGCKITFFEQWDDFHFDGVGYSYIIVDRQNNSRRDQSDEYPLGSLDHANRNAVESIDDNLDKWWLISCLASNRNKHEHFPLSFHGEKEGAIKKGIEELANRYPAGWKHSVSVILGD